MTYPLRAVPKPPKREPKARQPMRRSRMKCGGPLRKVGKRGAAFWRRKNRAFRRWLVKEKPCELEGRIIRERLSPNDVPVRVDPFLYGSARAWVHRCWKPLDPAHVERQSRGAGDVGQCCVLCRPAHRLYDKDDDHRTWVKVTGLTQKEMERRAGGHGLAWVERGGKISEAVA